MELLTFSVFLAILILIFIIISIGYLIYAFVTNHNFIKRKLAFLALSLSFVLNSLPFFFLGIPDGVFFLIFYLFFIFIIWVIWITFAFDNRTFHIICGGFYLITAIIFTIICIKDGGHTRPLLALIGTTAFYTLCAFIIEKANSPLTKTLAVVLTLASFITYYTIESIGL